MQKKRLVVLVILVFGQAPAIKSDVYSRMYNDVETQNNNQGKQTIHTLKGHFNEEAQRLVKCAGTKEIAKNGTNLAPVDNVSRRNQTINLINNTNVDHVDVEMKVFADMLKDLKDNPSRRLYSQDKPPKSISDKTNSLVNSNDFVIDKTQKQLEFESLLINNEAAKTNKYTEDADNDDNTISSGKNNTRRVIPSTVNEAQVPINYFNPFENPPPKSYTPPDILNMNNMNYKVLLDNDANKLNSNNRNPIPDTKKVETVQFNSAAYESTSPSDVTSEYSDKTRDTADGAIDLFSYLNQKISSEELNNLTGDPSKGFGISDMDRSNFMLIDHPRVCYACSSTNDPSCWSPDKWTPTKYCRQDHGACLTKIYRYRGLSFVIRDCGNSCLKRDLAEHGIHYESCTICHSDLCNGAYSVHIYALNIIIMLVTPLCFKFTV